VGGGGGRDLCSFLHGVETILDCFTFWVSSLGPFFLSLFPPMA